MRAVLLGVLGAALAVGGAHADGCRTGQMSLSKAGTTFRVADASAFASQGSERLVLKGVIRGAPHIIDLQSSQGSSAFLTSYKGRVADAGGMPVRWGRRSVRRLSNGGLVEVENGPLSGEWRVSCRS